MQTPKGQGQVAASVISEVDIFGVDRRVREYKIVEAHCDVAGPTLRRVGVLPLRTPHIQAASRRWYDTIGVFLLSIRQDPIGISCREVETQTIRRKFTNVLSGECYFAKKYQKNPLLPKATLKKPEQKTAPWYFRWKNKTFCGARVKHELYATNAICLRHHPDLQSIFTEVGTVGNVPESIHTSQQANPSFQVF